MFQAFYDVLFRGPTFFLAFFIFVTVVMTARGLLGRLRAYLDWKGWYNYSEQSYGVTVFVTIFREDPVLLERCLRDIARSLERVTDNYTIFAIVDGVTRYQEESEVCRQIARRYADVVMETNAHSKRKNLRNMMVEAKQRGLLHEISFFLDSDTVLDHLEVARELLRPFADPKIGGVTTAQRAYDPATVPERIGDWLEHARLLSSMAAGSLFGQIGCLPGRLYAVRSAIVADKMDALVEDYWRAGFLLRRRVQCHAGDDRAITNFVLRHPVHNRTVVAFGAGVQSKVPDEWDTLWRTWRRWATSSQGYTLRTLHWLWRRPYILFQYVTDIMITVGVVYLVAVHVPVKFLVGEAGLALWISATMAVAGMFATVLVRQWRHLAKHPRDILIVPQFTCAMLVAQLIRFRALFEASRIGVWGTRGVSAQHGQEFARVVWVRCVDNQEEKCILETDVTI